MATNKELEQGRQVFGENSAGYNAFKDAYERLKGQAQAQKQSVGQSYANIYQQALSQQYDRGLGAAAAGGGFTGGQRQMQTQRANANTMGVLSNIQTQGRQALSDVDAQGASAYSNALLEGQQAQEYANAQRQSNYALYDQVQTILNDNSMKPAEQRRRVEELTGMPFEQYIQNQIAKIRADTTLTDAQKNAAIVKISSRGQTDGTTAWDRFGSFLAGYTPQN